MNVGELIKYLEEWAPPGAAWDRDNVGLQIGSREKKLNNIMLCLELTQKVLHEAINKKCNFIFTHHPLIFNPIKNLDTQKDFQAQLIEKIIKNNITVYSAHTNLDFTNDGVSFELAKTLKLKNITFLKHEEGSQFKIAVFVPANSLEKVSDAVFAAGAGTIGEYKNCSFSTNGIGTFVGSDNTNPAVGKKLNFEKIEEARLEFIVDSWNLRKVLSALIKAHPYEEPAYDVYPLKNMNANYGEGAVGELELAINEKDFLAHVCKSLKIETVRFSRGTNKKIKKVAVCGGAGSSLLNIAIAAGADAFVTADIKYHTFHDALENILFIDAGHYETEIFSLNSVQRKVEKFLGKNNTIKIYRYSGSTNPVRFFKH